MIYTVLVYHEHSRQVAAHHVEAEDGMDALRKIAKVVDGELVVAIAGEHREAHHQSEEHKDGTLTFAGDGLVECDDYLKLFEERA